MLNNIQALRAAAAYLIVLAHMGGLGVPFTERMFVGVDLFFVISGFVMVHSTTGRNESPGSFARKRVIRIVPLYWLLTALVAVAATIVPSMMNHTNPDIGQIIKSLTFLGYDKHDGLVRPLLAPGWTLNLEMMFYLIFAVALGIPRQGRRIAAVSGTLSLLVLSGLILKPKNPVLEFYTSTILAEFIFGMILGQLQAKIVRVRHEIWLAVGAAAFIIMLSPISTQGPWRMLAPGVPAMAIVFCAIALEARGFRVTWKTGLLLGNASYSLYLTHLFVITPYIHAARGLGLDDGYAVMPSVTLALLLSTAAAVACYRYIEQPMTAALRRSGVMTSPKFRRRPWTGSRLHALTE